VLDERPEQVAWHHGLASADSAQSANHAFRLGVRRQVAGCSGVQRLRNAVLVGGAGDHNDIRRRNLRGDSGRREHAAAGQVSVYEADLGLLPLRGRNGCVRIGSLRADFEAAPLE
jgi:hypothetical protein